jgi:hypothetical protein
LGKPKKNTKEGFQIERIQQFITLRELLCDIHLAHDAPDVIHWKFMDDGK